jgi:hypothetical protein
VKARIPRAYDDLPPADKLLVDKVAKEMAEEYATRMIDELDERAGLLTEYTLINTFGFDAADTDKFKSVYNALSARMYPADISNEVSALERLKIRNAQVKQMIERAKKS